MKERLLELEVCNVVAVEWFILCCGMLFSNVLTDVERSSMGLYEVSTLCVRQTSPSFLGDLNVCC